MYYIRLGNEEKNYRYLGWHQNQTFTRWKSEETYRTSSYAKAEDRLLKFWDRWKYDHPQVVHINDQE